MSGMALRGSASWLLSLWERMGETSHLAGRMMLPAAKRAGELIKSGTARAVPPLKEDWYS